MTTETCVSCQKPKAHLRCGACESAVCKACAQFVDENTFAYDQAKPEHLKQTTFCPACFDEKVSPALAEYEEILARAKDVNVFFKTQGKESRFIRRTEKPIKVENCADRDDTVLHLAFVAAKAGYNALLDVDVQAEKVRMAGWQTSNWSGTAIPANVDPEQLRRRFISSPN